MANTQEMSPYQLTAGQQLLLGIPYLLYGCLWLPDTQATLWVQFLQAGLGLGAFIAAIGWLFTYQRRRLTQYSACLPIFYLPAIILLISIDIHWRHVFALGMLPPLFLLSGLASCIRQKSISGIPEAAISLTLMLKLALDEVMLGYFVSASKTPGRRRVAEIGDEVHVALEVMSRNGWLADPASFHRAPPEPAIFDLDAKSALGKHYQALRFPSQYKPHPEMPGAERWLNNKATQTMHARVFEHQHEMRPWLMCIHGYRMGWPLVDFQLFSPGWLHQKLGFNLIMPILPLHGLRKEGFRSGDGFFEGDLLNLLHAEAQAQSDLRACIQWLRSKRTVSSLAVYGLSLGGLNASLLSCLEPDIDSVIAGIPLVSPHRVFELNAPAQLVKGLAAKGVSPEVVRTLLKPVSPLEMLCKVPVDARAIIAGSQDRILPLEPIQSLHEHWQKCRLHWYGGTHLSVRREPEVGLWLRQIWQSRGLLDHLESKNIQSSGLSASAAIQ